MPPPPGHREIQQQELSRLFGQLVSARVVALPIAAGLVLWLAWEDPAPWRKALLVLSAAFISTFFIVEAVRFRRRGFTPGALTWNIAIGVVAQLAITGFTGGLASPFVYVVVILGIMAGVFVPMPLSAILTAIQVAGIWLLAVLGATGAIADLNIALFGGGSHVGNPAYVWVHATALSLVVGLSSGGARRVRRLFEGIVRRALAAQEESLRAHAERAQELTALSAEIAHELKNPLASVKGLAGLLAPHLPEGKGAERLAVLRREVDRMQGILDEFLNFSRPLVPLALGETDLGALCREVAALHEGVAQERGVAVELRAPRVAARCDPRKVKQILINLVQNAIDAAPRGTVVELEAVPDADGGARVRVLDRGPGVDPGVAGAVFDPGVTTKARGSGLGLTIARALARQHGGDVTLEARDGGGTAATLALPARPDARPGEAA